MEHVERASRSRARPDVSRAAGQTAQGATRRRVDEVAALPAALQSGSGALSGLALAAVEPHHGSSRPAPRERDLPARDGDSIEAPLRISGSIAASAFGPAPRETEDPQPLEADSTTAGGPPPAGRRAAEVVPGRFQVRLTHLATATTTRQLASMPADEHDAVNATPTTATVVSGGRAVSPFGALNRSWAAAVPSYTLKSADTGNSVDLAVAFTQTGHYGTNSGGKIDVPSATDAVVTADSYPKIVSDLTPRAKELSWVANRTQYWSQAICERHERFHANDVKAFGDSTGKDFVRNYLNGKTLSLNAVERADGTVVQAKVQALVEDARDALQNATTEYMRGIGNTYYSYPGEQRAFGDGKIPYETLVSAVKTRGETLAAEAKAKAEAAAKAKAAPAESPAATTAPVTPPDATKVTK